MTKEQITEEINCVFSDTVYPGDDLIVIYSPYATIYPAYEGNEVKEVFKGKKWQEVDQKELAKTSLGFLTCEAFRYYLPACMLLIIEDITEADVQVMSILRMLTLQNIEDVTKWNAYVDGEILRIKDPNREEIAPGIKGHIKDVDFLEKMKHTEEDLQKEIDNFDKMVDDLSEGQARCVRHFLEYIDQANPGYFDEDEIKIAIERYWKNFKD